VAANVVVLDDVTPRYLKAGEALKACDAGLGVALHFPARIPGMHDTAGNHHRPPHGSDRTPHFTIN
jgi:hypothetical protein